MCPVEAIYPADQVPGEWSHYTKWNEYLSEKWRELGYNITKKNGPFDEAEEWEQREKKLRTIFSPGICSGCLRGGCNFSWYYIAISVTSLVF